MAVDMFLKLEGVKGESQDTKHKEEIDIVSFSYGVQQTGAFGSGGGGGAGKASFTDLSVSKFADKASPILMRMCATGEHIKSAVLTVRKAGKEQQEYYVIKLTDLLVSGVSNAGAGHENPSEELHLNYSKIEFNYKAQKADGTLDGSVDFKYDVKANNKF